MIWITGLPCSGKTSLAKAIKKRINSLGTKCIHLDGDDLRKIMNIDYSDKSNFTEQRRLELSEIYSRFANLLEDQGFLTIVSTVSMNHHIRKINRKINNEYFEIYIKESFEILKKRDNKHIYKDLTPSEIKKMWIKAERPINPDLIIPMDEKISVDDCVNLAMNAFMKK